MVPDRRGRTTKPKKRPAKRRRGEPRDVRNLSEVAAQLDRLTQDVIERTAEFTSKVGPGGRLQIPAGLRRLLGLEVGREVLLVPDADGRLIVTNREAALRFARQLVRRRVPVDRSLADELLAERRREAVTEIGHG